MAVSKSLILFILFVALFVVYIIGFAADYWTSNGRFHSGLWLKSRGRLSSKFKAVQAMMCLGLISLIIAALAYIVCLIKIPEQLVATARKIAPILTILGGICGVIGCIIYWASFSTDNFIPDGFALIFAFISSVLFIVHGVYILVTGNSV